MKIYAYDTVASNTHCTILADDIIRIGLCMPNGKHYFAAEDDVEIPDQPAEINWAEVTDEDELAQMVQWCPAFFGDREALKATLGL
jgi:hypothetical protein